MFCTNCGTESQTGLLCPTCQTPIKTVDNSSISHWGVSQQGGQQQMDSPQLNPQTNFVSDEWHLRKRKLRNNAAGFAIAVGVLTVIGAFVLPLIAGDSLTDPFIMFQVAYMIGFAAVFITLGIIFIKIDNAVVAVLLIIAFSFYVFERVIMIIMHFNFGAVIWLVFGISALVSLIRYLNMRKPPVQNFHVTPPNIQPQNNLQNFQNQNNSTDKSENDW